MAKAVSVELPVAPSSALKARDALKPLGTQFDRTSYADALLLVSELVNEALLADEGEGRLIGMKAEIRGDHLHVEMNEGRGAYPLKDRPEPGDPGWGMYLVAKLARRWGIERERDRACVWLDLPLRKETLASS